MDIIWHAFLQIGRNLGKIVIYYFLSYVLNMRLPMWILCQFRGFQYGYVKYTKCKPRKKHYFEGYGSPVVFFLLVHLVYYSKSPKPYTWEYLGWLQRGNKLATFTALGSLKNSTIFEFLWKFVFVITSGTFLQNFMCIFQSGGVWWWIV